MNWTMGRVAARLAGFLLAFLGLLTAGEAQAVWRELPDITARRGTAMAYDAARGVTILFGGHDGRLRNDTWQWDGSAWTRRLTPTMPAAMTNHVMVYDSLRQRVLLHGYYAGAVATELWSWNGADWAAVATVHHPNSYSSVAMVYDSGRDRVVLCGANSGNPLAVWEYDGIDWSERTGSGPNWPMASYCPMVAYDAGAGNVAYFIPSPSPTMMWRWDGTVWSRQTAPPFHQAVEGRMVFDPVRNQLLMVSGSVVQGPASTIYRWSSSTATWIGLSLAGPMVSQPAVTYDTARDRVLLFGGTPVGTPAESGLWEWDSQQWRRACSGPPYVRHGHHMAYSRSSDRLVLYGGTNYTILADTWVRENGQWRLAVPQPFPVPSSHPGQQINFRLVHDEARDQTLLIGSTGIFEFWRFLGTQWQRVPTTATPPPRGNPGVVYDRRRQQVVMFGGAAPAAQNDLWTWNGSVWSQQFPLHAPSARHSPGMAYDVVRDRIVVVGGSVASGTASDTWEFDGVDWSVTPSATLPVGQAAMLVYDEAREVSVGVFRQVDQSLHTWQWDGEAWRASTVAPVPPPRSDGALVATAEGPLLFGGTYNTTYQAAMWRLETISQASFVPFGTPGASSAGPLTLRGVGQRPWLGTRCRVEFGNLPAVAIPGLWIGLSRTSWSGLPLPRDLGFTGFPGQLLWISLDGPWPVTNGGIGQAHAAIDIPSHPSFSGVQLFLQAFVYEPLTQDLTTSNGLDLTLRIR